MSWGIEPGAQDEPSSEIAGMPSMQKESSSVREEGASHASDKASASHSGEHPARGGGPADFVEEPLRAVDVDMLDSAWSAALPGVDYVRTYREATAAVRALREAHQEFVKHRGPNDRMVKLQLSDGTAVVGWFLEPAAWLEVAALMRRGGESGQ